MPSADQSQEHRACGWHSSPPIQVLVEKVLIAKLIGHQLKMELNVQWEFIHQLSLEMVLYEGFITT
jgi:hypothetical protein